MRQSDSNSLPSRFDWMGDYRDDDQRPSKRIRLDQPDGSDQAPPPATQTQEDATRSPRGFRGSRPAWAFNRNGATVPGPVTMAMPDPEAVVSIPDAGFPMIESETVLLDDSIIPWDTTFDLPPNPADISAAFPLEAQVAFPLVDAIVPSLPIPGPPLPSQAVPQQLQAQQIPQPVPQPVPQTATQPPRQIHVQPPQQPSQPAQYQPSRNGSISTDASQEQRRRKSRSKTVFTSPFTDCIDTFGKSFALKQFARPTDGKVNGYIKFSWPRQKEQSSRVVDVTEVVTELDDDEPVQSGVLTHISHSASGFDMSMQRRGSASPSVSSTITTFITGDGSPYEYSSSSFSSFDGSNSGSPFQVNAVYLPHQSPRQVPPHFGHVASMDHMDRKLFKFYLNNWCPGRSTLKRTNLWFTDFAKMHDSMGVLAAIQSLAGVYIHDYLPDEVVRRRINDRFAIAESRLSRLLQDQNNLNEREQSELITLASLLSMQDIVLTERRLKKPYHPRWLQGFKQAEQVLHLTDPGNRFYKNSNVQVDALRLSQSVIVGRAVILAQPMMALPSPATLDPLVESARFGFLLYGSEQEMYEIHGGCGFSKRLLHLFSQVTYCAARMIQEPETPVVPVTADMLYGELAKLRQWSGEFTDWDRVCQAPQPIEWIRQVDETYVVQSSQEMTDVTGEAWRLACMVYLQCRLLRLPRSHPLVLANLGDLAKSIAIMPTSGAVFTAQAPLLPVFLLGLLATVDEHLQVATFWFEQVIRTPVRSSVPPLYESLERIQNWMPSECPTPAPNTELPGTIAGRQPWWERMVSRVQEKEGEVLCLT